MISIANNDPNRDPYTFVVRGNTANQSCGVNPFQNGLSAPDDDIFIEMDRPYDIEVGNTIQAWPNPVLDQLNIESPILENPYGIEVISADGRILYRSETTGGRLEVQTTGWHPGLYFIRALGTELPPLRFLKL
jgi:hypothetical protein